HAATPIESAQGRPPGFRLSQSEQAPGAGGERMMRHFAGGWLIVAIAAPASVFAQTTPAADDSVVVANVSDEARLTRDDIEVRPTGLIDLNFQDADIGAILRGLSYKARASIVTSTSVTGTVSVNLYDVTLAQALDAILIPNGFAHCRVADVIFVGTPDEVAAQGPAPVTVVLRLNHISREEATRALEPLKSAVGDIRAPGMAGSSGGAGGSKSDADLDPDTNSKYLLVTDTPDRIEQMRVILREIDQRPKQVLVEATILRATLNEDNQFGIDFTFLQGVDFENLNSTSNASLDISPGQLPTAKLQTTTLNVNTNFLDGFPNTGLRIGVLKDNFGAFIRALEEVTDVVVVANPKVLALNRQESTVLVGRRDGYITTTVTETAAVQTVEFLETGTEIRFRPIINEDGSVRLRVHPKDSNGGLTQANLPFEETTETDADILVEDGHTVLIGGLFRERTVSSRGQTPLLGSLPGVGELFQRHLDQTVREEVIVLLTVHVLKDTPEQDAASDSLLNDIERVRVGSRQGLFGLGRERLAQAYFQEAVQQFDAGDRELALMNVRMALHNQPKHIGAIKLEERLLRERQWDATGTRMRAYLIDLLHDDPGEGGVDMFGAPETARAARSDTDQRIEDTTPASSAKPTPTPAHQEASPAADTETGVMRRMEPVHD
ncbi:MAG: hypothetical protein KDA32_15130, partial [Phycisphaerales bacterium]|nr:hypothetical protein [Phycisphaerales bacterium]